VLVFVEGGKPGKTLEARRGPATNSAYIWHLAGIEPDPHWWEASGLTAAPSLIPK